MTTPSATAGSRIRRRTPRTWLQGGGLTNLLFLVPLLLVFGVFSWNPIVQAVIMSVQHTNLVTEPQFVGFANFAHVFADPTFYTAVQNTGYFALLALVLGYPVPLVAAVLMSE